MNVLNKALCNYAFFYCIAHSEVLTGLEENRQTIRNNSASVIGRIHWKIMRCSFQADAFLPTITWRTFEELLHTLGDEKSQHGASTYQSSYVRLKFFR